MGERPHREIFRPHAGNDIERICLVLIGKLHVSCDGRLPGYGDSHRAPRFRAGFPGDRLRGGTGYGIAGHHGFILVHRPDGKLGTDVYDPAIGIQKCGVRPGGSDKSVEQGAAVLQIGICQRGCKIIHLPRQIIIEHRGIRKRGSPGNHAKGNGPGTEQNERCDEENPGRQALSEFLSQHGTPPLSRFQCSRGPACDEDF